MSKWAASFRLVRAAYIMAREGVFAALPMEDIEALPAFARKLAKFMARRSALPQKSKTGQMQKEPQREGAMARAMHRLGPFYIKFGQFLATRPDIIGRAAAEDLSSLQDKVKPFPQELAIAQLEKTLNRPLAQIFSRLDPPIAAASMAQVHCAFIAKENGEPSAAVPAGAGYNVDSADNIDSAKEDGKSVGAAVEETDRAGNYESGGAAEEEVASGAAAEILSAKRAVKIMRPHLRRAFSRDLESFYLAAHFAEKHIPYMRRLRPVGTVKNLEQITRLEMDMRLEAAALSEMAENIAKGGDKGFRVPKVDWERSGRDCLTMEWIDGIRISERAALQAAGHNTEHLATALMQSFLRHALRDGFFHADMHPGNLFVDKDGVIAAVDLGIMGRLGNKEQRFLAEILYGFITRDYHRIARVHFEAGYVPSFHSMESFAQANRAIGEPIYGQSVETISMARLLGLLFEITELFDMQTRPELLLLQKNMVVVEGVARSLDPHFNMWKAAEPIVRAWVAQNLGPAGALKDAAEAASAIAGFARRAPQLLARAEETGKALQRQSRRGLKLDKESMAELARLQWRQNRVWRWVMAAVSLGFVAWLWLHGG